MPNINVCLRCISIQFFRHIQTINGNAQNFSTDDPLRASLQSADSSSSMFQVPTFTETLLPKVRLLVNLAKSVFILGGIFTPVIYL